MVEAVKESVDGVQNLETIQFASGVGWRSCWRGSLRQYWDRGTWTLPSWVLGNLASRPGEPKKSASAVFSNTTRTADDFSFWDMKPWGHRPVG